MSRLPPWRTFSLTFAFLSLFGCRRLHKEAFEKVPLVRGQVDVVRVSETAELTVDRIRFWSDEMAEPRFFLALVPKTPAHVTEAFILNHGWWDRPERSSSRLPCRPTKLATKNFSGQNAFDSR